MEYGFLDTFRVPLHLQIAPRPVPDELEPDVLGRVRREGVARVRMLTILTASFLVFWTPLFLVTLTSWGWSWKQDQSSIAHEVR